MDYGSAFPNRVYDVGQDFVTLYDGSLIPRAQYDAYLEELDRQARPETIAPLPPPSLRERLWQGVSRRGGQQMADRLVGRPQRAQERPLSLFDLAGGGIVDAADIGVEALANRRLGILDALEMGLGIAEAVPAIGAAREMASLPYQVVREGFADIPNTRFGREYISARLGEAQDTWGPIGRSVDVYDPEGYRGMDLFMTPEGDAGFVVKPDGELASLVKAKDASIKDMAGKALRRGSEAGATWLNAFDTALTQMYGANKFRPVSRLPFDEDIVRSEWGDEVADAFMQANRKYSGGRPDLVFMARDPSFAGPVTTGQGGLLARDYDQAVQALEDELKRMGYR